MKEKIFYWNELQERHLARKIDESMLISGGTVVTICCHLKGQSPRGAIPKESRLVRFDIEYIKYSILRTLDRLEWYDQLFVLEEIANKLGDQSGYLKYSESDIPSHLKEEVPVNSLLLGSDIEAKVEVEDAIF